MADQRFEIRAEILRENLQNYRVAEKMGISNSAFYQKLQRPVDEEKAKPFYAAIRELIAEREKARGCTQCAPALDGEGDATQYICPKCQNGMKKHFTIQSKPAFIQYICTSCGYKSKVVCDQLTKIVLPAELRREEE